MTKYELAETPQSKKVKYKIGDMFIDETGVLIVLAQVQASMCCLITLPNQQTRNPMDNRSNRLRDPVYIRDIGNITTDDLYSMYGSDHPLTPVTSVAIQYTVGNEV